MSNPEVRLAEAGLKLAAAVEGNPEAEAALCEFASALKALWCIQLPDEALQPASTS